MEIKMRTLQKGIVLAFGALTLCCVGGEEPASDTGATATAAGGPAETPESPDLSIGPDSAAIPAGFVKAAFLVDGMTCNGCVLGTRMALAKVAGVSKAEATYDEKTKKGTAWAIYDPATATPAQLIAAIRKLGYEPTPIGG
jgi:copper chaperone